MDAPEPPIIAPSPPSAGAAGFRWAVLFAALAVAGCALFFLGMLAVKLGAAWGQPQPAVFNTSTVLKQVQALSELVTVKYVLEKVVIVEDPRWYGENRLLLLAHGIVKAGVDLSELKPEHIQIDGRTITMVLPMERVTDAYLDERKTHVIEHTTGLVRLFDKDLETNARRAAVADIRSAARHAGILDDARERAKLQLRVLFLQLGFEQVEFRHPSELEPDP